MELMGQPKPLQLLHPRWVILTDLDCADLDLQILLDCAEDLNCLHCKGLLHCDVKSVTEQDGLSRAILIDFGKVREVSKAKRYRLTSREQETYRIKHQHIAPEVVRGVTTTTTTLT